MVFWKRRPVIHPAGAGSADSTPAQPAAPDAPAARLCRAAVPADRGIGSTGVHGATLALPADQPLVLQVDGTPGMPPRGIAGLGMVLRQPNGQLLMWHTARAAAATCNEAEYQALIAGLQWVLEHSPQRVICCLSDSQTVVEQMCGRARVRAGPLQPLHAQATHLAGNFAQISYVAISRELNRLADALAWEALGGRRGIVLALRSGGVEK